MCGRYVLKEALAEIADRFGVAQATLDLKPNYNVAPSQYLPVILALPRGSIRHLGGMP